MVGRRRGTQKTGARQRHDEASSTWVRATHGCGYAHVRDEAYTATTEYAVTFMREDNGLECPVPDSERIAPLLSAVPCRIFNSLIPTATKHNLLLRSHLRDPHADMLRVFQFAFDPARWLQASQGASFGESLVPREVGSRSQMVLGESFSGNARLQSCGRR